MSVNSYSLGASEVILPHVVGGADEVLRRATTWKTILEHTELVVAFGGMNVKNAWVSPGGVTRHTLAPSLEAAAERGLRSSSSARCATTSFRRSAATWHPIVPGTDTAVMLGLAYVLVTEGLHDTAFLDRYCVGADRLIAYIIGDDDGQPKDPEWASAISGIPADTIRDARAPHGRAPHARHRQLGAATHASRRAAGVDGHRARGAARPDRPARRRIRPRLRIDGRRRSAPRAVSAAHVPAGPPPGQHVHPGRADHARCSRTRAARSTTTATSAAARHPARVLGGRQPVPSSPGPEPAAARVRARPDTVVVHDPFWTATARHADIVLPTTTTLERDDVGRAATTATSSRCRGRLSPYGEARDDYEIFADLAKDLDAYDDFTEGRTARDWVEHIYDRFRTRVGERGVDVPAFDEFWADGRGAPADQLRRPHAVRPLPRRPRRAQARDAERPHRAVLRDHRRLRLRRLSGPSRVARARRVAGRRARARSSRCISSRTSRRRACTASSTGARTARRRRSRAASRSGSIPTTRPRAGSPTATSCACSTIAARASRARSSPTTCDRRSSTSRPARGSTRSTRRSPDSMCAHGNPNVLTADRGSSRLAQGSTGQHVLVEIERFDGAPPPARPHQPPEFVARPQPAR